MMPPCWHQCDTELWFFLFFFVFGGGGTIPNEPQEGKMADQANSAGPPTGSTSEDAFYWLRDGGSERRLRSRAH